VIGTGGQACLQVLALAAERRFDTLLVWGREHWRADLLAQRLRGVLTDVRVQVDPDREAVVRASDVLITATASRDALVHGRWLHPGQHITAVGADDGDKCELDGDCFRRADLTVVDSRALNLQFGDVAQAIARGEMSRDDIDAELGQLVGGELAGRQHEEQITIAKHVGIGVEDLVAAEVALAKLQPTMEGEHQ